MEVQYFIKETSIDELQSKNQALCEVPYTAKLLSGKTFAVVHKMHYSLENFHSASGRGHHVLYTASNSRGKLSRLTKNLRKPRKFSHSKVLPYTVRTVHMLSKLKHC